LLEVDFRDGIAKVVTWETRQKLKLRTPAVLFLTSARAAPFPEAEAIVVGHGAPISEAKDTPVLIDGEVAGVDIPSGSSCPSYLADFIKDPSGALGKDGRIMQVGPRPPEKVPDTVEVVVAGNIAGLLGDTKRLVPYMTALRRTVGYSRLVYAPNAGEPAHMALLAYLGVDLFGSIPLALAARQGTLLFPDGKYGADEAWKAHLCHCPSCIVYAKEKGGPGAVPEESYRAALMHNYHIALQECRMVRHAISRSTIRELVEARVRSEPWLVASLRELDLRHYDSIERYLPVSKPFLMACSRESLHRPEVVRFQRRFREWYARPPSTTILLLLPCSARKPYSRSPTHRAIGAAVEACKAPHRVHKVVVTSPLGIVPMELEQFYPANCYDIAVTGDWDTPEIKTIKDGLDLLIKRGHYSAVVSYLGSMPFIAEVLEANRRTMMLTPQDPRRREDLASLTSALDGMLEVIGPVGDQGKRNAAQRRRGEDFAAFARFQFGPGAEALVDKVSFSSGHLKLFKDGKQTGTLNEERGLISLTLEGGEIIKGLKRHIVEIEDFEPTGTIFVVGVKGATEDIRPGDDVVVVRNGELAGVGVAVMGGPEMNERRAGRRGAAVEIRHRRKAA
jgi:archaeosine synthase